LDLLVGELGKGSEFNVLSQVVPINLPPASVTLCLPADLVKVDPTADARRSKLTIVTPMAENNLIDMLTYEGSVVDSAGGKQHYYLYVGAINLGEGANDGMMGFWTSLRPAIRSLSAFEDVQVAARDGSMVTCRKCQATLPQVFYYTKPGGGDDFTPPVEGLVEIWDRRIESADKHLVMIWRVPTVEGKDYINLDKKARLVAGGIGVSAK
jgi:hypothetical protein